MDSRSTLTLASTTRVDLILPSSSALPVVDAIPQGKGKSETAENPGEVRLTYSPAPHTPH